MSTTKKKTHTERSTPSRGVDLKSPEGNPEALYGPCVAAFPEGQRAVTYHLLNALRLPAAGTLVDILTTAMAVAEDDLRTADVFEREGAECRAEEQRQNVQAYLGAMLEFSHSAQECEKDHAKKAGAK